MSEPIKPRIDFDEPLQPPQEPALRAGFAFDAEQAESWLRRSCSRKRKKGAPKASLTPR